MQHINTIIKGATLRHFACQVILFSVLHTPKFSINCHKPIVTHKAWGFWDPQMSWAPGVVAFLKSVIQFCIPKINLRTDTLIHYFFSKHLPQTAIVHVL